MPDRLRLPDCPRLPNIAARVTIDQLFGESNASFRQLMLDRIAVLSPEWQERNPADVGIALIELLAYAGDYLSYRQDAVATEAYRTPPGVEFLSGDTLALLTTTCKTVRTLAPGFMYE